MQYIQYIQYIHTFLYTHPLTKMCVGRFVIAGIVPTVRKCMCMNHQYIHTVHVHTVHTVHTLLYALKTKMYVDRFVIPGIVLTVRKCRYM